MRLNHPQITPHPQSMENSSMEPVPAVSKVGGPLLWKARFNAPLVLRRSPDEQDTTGPGGRTCLEGAEGGLLTRRSGQADIHVTELLTWRTSLGTTTRELPGTPCGALDAQPPSRLPPSPPRPPRVWHHSRGAKESEAACELTHALSF